MTGVGAGVVLCSDAAAPPLLLEPSQLVLIASCGGLLVLILMFIHYMQPLAQAATSAHAAANGTRTVDGDEEAAARPSRSDSVVEVDFLFRTRSLRPAKWLWLRCLDFPWLEAEFEGDAFYNFVVTLILEAVLNATSTANTYLEGDLEFSNDEDGVMLWVSWLLIGIEVVSISCGRLNSFIIAHSTDLA